MSVTSVCEAPTSPEAQFSKDKVSYTRTFVVITNDYDDGPQIVLTNASIPAINSSYAFGDETSATATVVSKDAKRREPNSLVWEVTVNYETPDQEDNSNDPTLEQPQVKVSFEKVDKPMEQGFTLAGGVLPPGQQIGQMVALLNSAGDTFDPLPSRESYMMVISINRNEAAGGNPHLAAIGYIGQYAKDKIMGLDGGHLRGVDIEKLFRTNKNLPGVIIPYFRVGYVIDFPEQIKLLDIGPHYLAAGQSATDPATVKAFVDEQGHPRLGLLDGKGGALNGTGRATDPPKAPPVFLGPYRPTPPIPFAPLRLPQSFLEVQASFEF